MDRIVQYKNIARTITASIADKLHNVKEVESFLIHDDLHGQYLVMHDGWEGIERRYAIVAHIQIAEDGKVWLRQDATDLEIGQELLDNGVSSEDLVLAFYSPILRKFTPYAKV